MVAGSDRSHHSRIRVLAHIKKLDDCFGQFLVRVTCVCGASRHIEPEALARLVGWPRGCAARSAEGRLPRWWQWRGPGQRSAEESALTGNPSVQAVPQ
jgi:hypothetical protein